MKANPGLTTLETEYANEKYAIGVAKGNTALLDAVNGALKELTGGRHDPVHHRQVHSR